jgi:hypothetical protein
LRQCVKYSNKLLETIRELSKNSIGISPAGLKICQTCFFTTSVNGNEKQNSLPQPGVVKRVSSQRLQTKIVVVETARRRRWQWQRNGGGGAATAEAAP